MRLSPVFLLMLLACRSEKETADTSAPVVTETDLDGDGFSDDDCDDSDGSVYPGADEICDGVDNNCDGTADEGATSPFYADSDGDGFGDPAVAAEACEAPDGYVSVPNDCDDTDAESFPGASERCDGKDNDCDGTVDEDVQTAWYADTDGDRFGNPAVMVEDCDPPDGYVVDSTDCDDLDDTSYPGGAEICDEADNNCDGTVDEGVTTTYYQDTDSDGFGVAAATTESCELPGGYSAQPGDCDDADAAVSPDAEEVCDEIDNDCDGTTDEDDAADASTWYADADGDGYGDPDDSDVSCMQPAGYVADDTDCDDTEPAANPGTAEVCDEIDNDCDGDTDEDSATDASTWYADSDGDGYGSTSSTVACDQPTGFADNSDDCDDGEASASPAVVEVCDEIDNDCDGDTDEGLTSTFYADADGDGYGNAGFSTTACDAPTGYVSDDTDCDDGEAAANPGGAEVCDEIDNNCDGDTDEGVTSAYYADADGDGFGDAGSSTDGCEAPSGYTEDDSDCDDLDSAISPDGEEVCDDVDNDCDGDIDEDGGTSAYYADADEDGYGDPDVSVVRCEAPSDYVSDGTDCDDADAAVNPGAAELIDGLDNDCDGDGYDGSYEVTSDANLTGDRYEFTRLEIASGVTVTVTGSTAAEVYVLEDAIIDGTIDLAGEDGRNHGAFISTANAGGDGGGGGGGDGGEGSCYYCGDHDGEDGGGTGGGGAGDGGGAGGGGAGGGNATAGDNGSNGICTSSRCGSSYTVSGGTGGAALAGSSPALYAGGGGGGGGYGGADNGDGGGGGGGGGALMLQAAEIEVAGLVDCSGGDGGSDSSGYDGGSGGGGAGGTLWLVAAAVDISGTLRCTGGSGGTTVIGGTSAQGGFGGDGSDGVIWVDADSLSVSGTISPSYTSAP